MNSRFQHVLALDASTSRASVALFSNQIWYEAHIGATALHAQSLLPMIDDLLNKANLSPQTLDAIVFGQGPGSFTGLRIACSIAKGLAYAHDLPLYALSGLMTIAHQVFEKTKAEKPVLAAIDARMNQLYWGYYATSNLIDSPEYVTCAQDISLPENENFIFAGVGLKPYEKLISDQVALQISEVCEIYPSARTLIEIIQTTEIQPVDVFAATPVYIRNHVTHGEGRG